MKKLYIIFMVFFSGGRGGERGRVYSKSIFFFLRGGGWRRRLEQVNFFYKESKSIFLTKYPNLKKNGEGGG